MAVLVILSGRIFQQVQTSIFARLKFQEPLCTGPWWIWTLRSPYDSLRYRKESYHFFFNEEATRYIKYSFPELWIQQSVSHCHLQQFPDLSGQKLGKRLKGGELVFLSSVAWTLNHLSEEGMGICCLCSSLGSQLKFWDDMDRLFEYLLYKQNTRMMLGFNKVIDLSVEISS